MKRIRSIVIIIIFTLAVSPLAAVEKYPPATPESQGISSEALQKIKDIIQGYLEADQIVGAELLVIKNRHTILHEAFGWKDKEDELKMEKDTLFNLRSMTKPLTGAAAQVLIDEGKLKPSDPVASYIPGFKNSKSEAITVGQLLFLHTGP